MSDLYEQATEGYEVLFSEASPPFDASDVEAAREDAMLASDLDMDFAADRIVGQRGWL